MAVIRPKVRSVSGPSSIVGCVVYGITATSGLSPDMIVAEAAVQPDADATTSPPSERRSQRRDPAAHVGGQGVGLDGARGPSR